MARTVSKNIDPEKKKGYKAGYSTSVNGQGPISSETQKKLLTDLPDPKAREERIDSILAEYLSTGRKRFLHAQKPSSYNQGWILGYKAALHNLGPERRARNNKKHIESHHQRYLNKKNEKMFGKSGSPTLFNLPVNSPSPSVNSDQHFDDREQKAIFLLSNQFSRGP